MGLLASLTDVLLLRPTDAVLVRRRDVSSPRRPVITIRTFSSGEYCRRVARRMSRTAFPASSECVSAFDLISGPSAVKMSQKSSLPQSLHTVQLVLTGNAISRLNLHCYGDRVVKDCYL